MRFAGYPRVCVGVFVCVGVCVCMCVCTETEEEGQRREEEKGLFAGYPIGSDTYSHPIGPEEAEDGKQEKESLRAKKEEGEGGGR